MNVLQATQQAVMVRSLMAALARAGVKNIFVAPGSRSTPLVQAACELAAHKPSPWRLWPVLDERAAAFAALGASRQGQLSAVICTSGTAVAHLLPACIEACLSRTCVVFATADRPPGAWRRGAPQSIDQPGVLQGVAGFRPLNAAAIHNGCDDIEWMVRASQVNGHPLHLNVHLDTPLALKSGAAAARQPLFGIAPNLATDTPLPPPKVGERALVIAGALPAHHAQAMASLVAHAGSDWQVLAEATSNLRPWLPAAAPIHFEAWLRDPAHRAAALPDRVVRVGAWPVSKGLQLLLEDCAAAGVPMAVVGRGAYSNPLDQRRMRWCTLNPADGLARWAQTRPPAAHTPWLQTLAALETVAAARRRDALATADAASNEPGILHAWLTALPARTPVQIANSMPIRHLEAFWPGEATAELGFSRGANGIDGTLATAWGRALALDRPSWVVLGDAALLHDATSLQLLRARPDLRVLCFDNDGGAIFDWLPAAQVVDAAVHRDYFTQPHGLDLAAVAQAFGVTAQVVQGPSVAETIANWARTGDGPQVVVAKTDASAARAVWRAWTGQ